MKPKPKAKEKRAPKLYEALLIFTILIVIMGVAIVVYEADPHIPMLMGTALAAIMAMYLGYSWKEIEDSMIVGITRALQSVMILAVIGVLIGTWVLAGVVPSMIYYGLQVIHPKIFLFATVLITSVTSIATGSSWGTAGTIGIALMGVSEGLGIPAPMTAGAIISGAYFGDKMSPLSDTTNLAPAMAGTDVFTHVKFQATTNIITYILTLIIFLGLGFVYGDGNASLGGISQIINGLDANFNISLWLLIPPVVVIVAVGMKMPALPGIFLGAILGMLFAAIFQGASLGDVIEASMYGFIPDTGVEAIDSLLEAGGLEGMMYSISLTIIAMMFGGIMESTGQLEVIVGSIVDKVKTTGGLIALTMGTGIFSNLTMPEQYISIVIPGRMYAETYRKRHIHPKTLSLTLETGGTLTSALIPWNTCGAFMYSVLGVSALQYAPWAILNYSTVILVLILGFAGSRNVIRKISDDPDTIVGLPEANH